MISNGDLSDPLCHSVNWSLQTLVRLGLLVTVSWCCLNFSRLEQADKFSQTTNLPSVLFCLGPKFYVRRCSIKRKCIEMTTLIIPCYHWYFSVECLFNRKIDDSHVTSFIQWSSVILVQGKTKLIIQALVPGPNCLPLYMQ